MAITPDMIQALIDKNRARPNLFQAGSVIANPTNPVAPGSLVQLQEKQQPGDMSFEDRSASRLDNMYQRLGVIDSISKDKFSTPSRDYLDKAEDIMFRANQVSQQAQILRLRNSIPRFQTGKFNNSVHFNFNGMGGGGKGATGGSLRARFIRAIAGKESGGRYGAVNSSSGALGKYQIMPGNIAGPGGWDREILGHNITTSRFLHSPRLQERIAQGKLTQYFRRYGAAGAASAWYSGSPTKWKTSFGGQGGYPSVHNYVISILKAIGAR